MKAWQRRKRWEAPEVGADDYGDMPDKTSRAWKAASPICRAAAGDPQAIPPLRRWNGSTIGGGPRG